MWMERSKCVGHLHTAVHYQWSTSSTVSNSHSCTASYLTWSVTQRFINKAAALICATGLCGNSMHGQADAPGISESNIVGWPLCTENQKLSPAWGSENLQPFGGMAQPPKERKAHCNLHEFIEIIKRESAACDSPTIRRRKPYTGQEKKGCSPCKQLFKIN